MKKNILVQASALVLAISMTGGCAVQELQPQNTQNTDSVIDSYITTPSTDTTPTETSAPETMVTVAPTNTPTEPPVMVSDSQMNSIAMLNYLTVLTQKINSSKNSRMFLEEAYASLINNTNPERVNASAESYLASLLDTIEKYRMIEVKRDRLQYIYEQNKAKAITAAIPNPVSLLSAVSSHDLKRLVASVIYMGVDAYASYNEYTSDINQEFLQENWELDDQEAANVHDSRKRAFMFMLEIVREERLPGRLALNEKSVEEFVRWSNADNLHQKLQFLESEQSTYEGFSNYWLELSDCYYELGYYDKCLESAEKYQGLQSDIFRKDYYWARELPKIIVAGREIYTGSTYISFAERHLEDLLQNTDSTDWSLRYFTAEMYMDLYAQTNDPSYLEYAFNIVLNNVNQLIIDQRASNQTYLEDVQEVSTPEDATKEEKKKIKDYNESISYKRKTELPPIYEPLRLNCELLFVLADKLDLSDTEKSKIDSILRDNGALFLNDGLEARYSFTKSQAPCDAIFEKHRLTLPVTCVNENAVIRATVTNGEEQTLYDDWTVESVSREGNDINNFSVVYTSEQIGDQQWQAESTVKIEIFPDSTATEPIYILHFKASDYNSWWVLPDSITFEQVN